MKNYDTISTRLSLILMRFNNGEKLAVDDLAEEFNVSPRTIQRDLNERFSHLSLKKEKGYYFVDESQLSSLKIKDIERFAKLSGVKGLFPTFDETFIKKILNSQTSPYLIKGYSYENINHKTQEFERIEKAILERRYVEFTYHEKRRKVEPYKFANVKGIWYLIALQDGVIKTFTFIKIKELTLLESFFTLDASILQKIEDEDSIWFSNDKTEVILKVDSTVSFYFQRREILPYQKTIEKLQEGTMILSTKVTYDEELFHIVGYWLPHVTIVSPLYLKNKFNKIINKFLNFS